MKRYRTKQGQNLTETFEEIVMMATSVRWSVERAQPTFCQNKAEFLDHSLVVVNILPTCWI